MKVEMNFPGGVVVEARLGSHTVRTDQPTKYGGGDSAPAPFDLFLASIGTCAGYYVVRFCAQRQIDTDGLKVTLEPTSGAEKGHISAIRIEVRLPERFPDKYRQAVLRAIDQCAVKKHLDDPPDFEVVAV
jgi:putative redox protein